MVFIISSKSDEISDFILKDLNHGATLLSGKGMYTGSDRPVLMTVVSNQNLSVLTANVKLIDDTAFMVVQNAHQVLGEGFMPIAKAINMQFGG